MKQPHHQSSVFKKTLNVLAWILIALLLAATLWAVQWAAKQPKVHSIWGEPSDSPITRNYTQNAQWVAPLVDHRHVFKGQE
jgi:hypothetical protein